MSRISRLTQWSTSLLALAAAQLQAQDTKFARPIVDSGDVKTAPVVPEGKAWQAPTAVPATSKTKTASSQDLPQAALATTGYDTSKVYYDQNGAGTIIASGNCYKAEFSAHGMTYVPFLGSQAPQNFPVQFTLATVQVGQQPLAFERQVAPVRDGNRVVYDRGTVHEIYDLTADGIEQTFVLVDTTLAGDIRVELSIACELSEDAGKPGIQFGNELGGVSYGSAFVVRQSGAKQNIATAYSGRKIELLVPQGQRDGAAPVTIDPEIGTYTVGNAGNFDFSNPDVAYDISSNQYMITWERDFSATDHDILAEIRSASGTLVAGSTDFIDNSTVDWRAPKIANLNAYNRYLIVAERHESGASSIWGRTRNASAAVVMSAQFQVSGNELGNKTQPDVGGDPSSSTPTYWTVVYRRLANSADSDIHARQVQEDATVRAGTIFIDNSGSTLDMKPSISKSNGQVTAFNQDWMVVWSRQFSATDTDAYGAVLHWDGTITRSAFGIDTTANNDTEAHVSSPTEMDPAAMRYLVVFERELTATDGDIRAVHVGKTGSVPVSANLSLLQNRPVGASQRQPRVDGDGCRFLVSYYEGLPGYAVPVHITNTGSLALSAGRSALSAATNLLNAQVCSEHSSGGTFGRYHVVYEDLDTNPNSIKGSLFTGIGAGGFSSTLPGCSGLSLSGNGNPWLGNTVNFSMSGQASDLRGMLFGLPGSPITICSNCVLGIDLAGPVVNLPNLASINLPIPCETSYLGATVSMQAYAFGTGPCTNLGNMRLSNRVDMTIQ